MRVVATACAGVLVACVAVAGVVVAQKPSLLSAAAPESTTPAPAAAPAVVFREVADSAATSANPSPALATTTGVRLSEPSPAAAPAAAPTVVAQAAPKAVPSAPAAPAAAPPPSAQCAGIPNALGIARTVEIDTTGGPGFGFEHFKEHDFLREGEVVLTFDDGPWPKHTQAVLAALRAHCTKAIFFPIGLHATYEPAIMKQVAADGHAIGSHTWCHQDLSKTKGRCLIKGKVEAVEYDPKDEIEKGISAVRWAAGGPTAPYFRFPALRQPPELIAYLGKRNIAMFSADFDSFDFKMRKPEQVRQAVMTKLKKHGKGIILMHDFQQATAAAAADLLNDLKAGGYKVVFMKPKDPVKTIASYDELVAKELRPSTGDGRPTSSVVRTIE
jgi:peptidoglycan/xylan/chitin deacetylase (PgdA/CDA1 family)